MNTERNSLGGSVKWLNILAIVSGAVFFLTSVYWVDFFMDRLYERGLLRPVQLMQAGAFAQYGLILAFFALITILLARRRGRQAIVPALAAGVVLVLFIILISGFKILISNVFLVPIGGLGSGSETINKVTLMITALSGLITAIAGLYGQILAHRKAMAEIELERLKLELEREKQQKGKGRRNSTKGSGT